MPRLVCLFLIQGILWTFFPATGSTECRFWATIAPRVPQDVTVQQLLTSPVCLKSLGEKYDDGWSVGFFAGREASIQRGSDPAHTDEAYDAAVQEAARHEPRILFSHLRWASSGCVEGVPNPHPFRREVNGTLWLFGHNGTIPKPVLIDLIGPAYLEEHPPTTCTDDPPATWIDSELYFIFLLKRIGEVGRVEEGLRQGLSELYAAIGEGRKALNFFLTNGEDLWAFRRGPTLFYTYQPDLRLSAVSSSPPEEETEEWHDVGDDTLVALTAQNPPRLIPLWLP